MGNKKKINLSLTDFKNFRKEDYLYVDKSLFIEHVLESDTVLLFCRPRRMGKSMNLTMLKYFFDMNEDNADLFQDLAIAKRPAYEKRNQFPVIYLNFRYMQADDYYNPLRRQITSQLKHYIVPEQYTEELKAILSEKDQFSKDILRYVCENLHQVYGKKTWILIDEYDKLFMDNINHPQFEEIRTFVKSVMASALKDNPYLEKAVITGVNRIAQESMFSDLNNIVICDVFSENDFDTDFGFTEEEVQWVQSQLPEQGKMEDLRLWYNNYRVGNHTVYFAFSVLSALGKGKLDNYWGRSGVMDMIKNHLTQERKEAIAELVNGFPKGHLRINVKDRLSVDDLRDYGKDAAFYSLLIQSGYLTHEKESEENPVALPHYLLSMPNVELKRVWQEFLFFEVYGNMPQALSAVFYNIPSPAHLEHNLTEALYNNLSYYDFETQEKEKTYHVYMAGIMTALGYHWKSNRESGIGRYDLLADHPKYNLLFEFKVAEDKEHTEQSAQEAIAQIKEKQYDWDCNPAKPTWLIGIGFYKKQCSVKVAISEKV